MKKLAIYGSAIAVALAALSGAALAEYPEKPVTFIVPWPPGDLEDVLTRMIAEEFQTQFGAPAAVVNKPGGGGIVGALEVAQSPADGYTIGSFVMGIPTVKTMGPDAQIARDTFEPIGIFLTYPFLIAAGKDAPYNTLQEMADYSKANNVRLGHFGYGLEPTLLTVLGVQTLGGKFGAEAAFDMLDCSTLSNGDADVINTTAQLVLPCLSEIKVLGTITGERMSITPDAPTLGELVPALDSTLWNGLFVPKVTPQDVKDKIAAAAMAVVASPEAQEIAKTTGALVYWMDAAASAERINLDYDQLKSVREQLGVTE